MKKTDEEAKAYETKNVDSVQIPRVCISFTIHIFFVIAWEGFFFMCSQ